MNEFNLMLEELETGKTAIHDKYVVTKNAIVYRNIKRMRAEYVLQQNVCAAKINGTIYGNSSLLDLLANHTKIAEIQTYMSESNFRMIPFSVFKEAGLNLNDLKILDTGPQEKLVVTTNDVTRGYIKDEYFEATKKIFTPRHFIGAMLFQVGDKIFLMDIDRNEIKHGIFNLFLSEIPTPVTTIKEAYEALKPDMVKQAESQGIPVLRQGEWFFIPTNIEAIPVKDRHETLQRAELKAGDNRPNYAELHAIVNDTLIVKGVVSHSGREHKDITLNSWHIPVPNTATKSFTIQGDVD
jgi:hypothetical protein